MKLRGDGSGCWEERTGAEVLSKAGGILEDDFVETRRVHLLLI